MGIRWTIFLGSQGAPQEPSWFSWESQPLRKTDHIPWSSEDPFPIFPNPLRLFFTLRNHPRIVDTLSLSLDDDVVVDDDDGDGGDDVDDDGGDGDGDGDGVVVVDDDDDMVTWWRWWCWWWWCCCCWWWRWYCLIAVSRKFETYFMISLVFGTGKTVCISNRYNRDPHTPICIHICMYVCNVI